MATRISQGASPETPWPAAPGTYLLALHAAEPVCVAIGRRGQFALSPGLYAYIGSAQGPGGLAARLARHLRADKRRHWHIDALTAALPIIVVGTAVATERLECAWVRHLLAEGAQAPIPGFGSSDCRAGCPAHLLRLPEEARQLRLKNLRLPGQPTLVEVACLEQEVGG